MPKTYVNTPGGGDYFIRTRDQGGAELPEYVLVEIRKCETKGRKKPPDPICGFETGYTPFAKGHVCALELGGPDISENIVPQWKCWQANGAWRRMEDSIGEKARDGDFYLCRMTYQTETPDQPLERTQDPRLYETQPLVEWRDFRIPQKFDVWIIAKNSFGYQERFSAARQQDILEAVEGHVESTLPIHSFFEQGGWSMPSEDHIASEDQIIRSAFSIYSHNRSADAEAAEYEQLRQIAMEQLRDGPKRRQSVRLQAPPPVAAPKVTSLVDEVASGGPAVEVMRRIMVEEGWLSTSEAAQFSAADMVQAISNMTPQKGRGPDAMDVDATAAPDRAAPRTRIRRISEASQQARMQPAKRQKTADDRDMQVDEPAPAADQPAPAVEGAS